MSHIYNIAKNDTNLNLITGNNGVLEWNDRTYYNKCLLISIYQCLCYAGIIKDREEGKLFWHMAMEVYDFKSVNIQIEILSDTHTTSTNGVWDTSSNAYKHTNMIKGIASFYSIGIAFHKKKDHKIEEIHCARIETEDAKKIIHIVSMPGHYEAMRIST